MYNGGTMPLSGCKGTANRRQYKIKKELFFIFTQVSHVVQVRAEGPKAPSPGHRPGYNDNQQGAL